MGSAHGANFADRPVCPVWTVKVRQASNGRWRSATFVARVLDKAGVDSAHIISAKTGGYGCVAVAADYRRAPAHSVASGPASVITTTPRSNIPQRDRLGSGASKDGRLLEQHVREGA